MVRVHGTIVVSNTHHNWLKFDFWLPYPMSVEQVIGLDGTVRWYVDGQLHRDDGPALTYPDGTGYWYRNGFFHREDGPAIVCHGVQIWYVDGCRHREDGPAVVYQDGRVYWYTRGKEQMYTLIKI